MGYEKTADTELTDRIVKPLLDWYDQGRRILPWREEPTSYHVWLSEIMLQQTRVEAVKPYYDRFLQALPDIESLAAVEEEHLLKLWEGLGYYNRARNLKKAAQIVVEEYEGRMPEEREALLSLPGIGSYTAGAIASIAFGKVYPAVDGNVLRILARLRVDDRDILDAKVKRAVEEELIRVMPKDRPGDFNQALMELGATVCIPNGAPRCESCPWEAFCMAKQEEKTAEFPKKAKKKPRRIEERTILVIQDADRIALRKRPDRGLLAGMYEFPSLDGHCEERQVASYLRELGLSPIRIKELPPAKHIFTHKEWHMIGYLVRVDELSAMETGEKAQTLVFVEPEKTRSAYPIPSAFAVYAEQVEMVRTNRKK
ncbi:MAG: A/G-specific adenine glycosylase [Lachnospiraceae bacterium]|nr:A/G-specific adenine glycosylase [Lachnospiraceae bacterium]